MPCDRQAQLRAALHAAAALTNLADSPQVRPMSGEWAGCHRLRVGSYRAILRVLPPELPDAPEVTLEVLAIGPRGDIYK